MTSKQTFELDAQIRHDLGKGASRRLRRSEKVPGIVYGGGRAPIALTLEHKHIAKSLENEAFYSHILTLKTDAESERVILKAIARHPYKPRIMHIDFQRVRADEKLHMHIPLRFIGESVAPGVKIGGGVVSHLLTDVEISCLPDDLPEYLEVNMSTLQLNQILHLSDIALPKGVELLSLSHGDNKPVASVHVPRVEEVPAVEEAPTPSEVPATAQKAAGEETKAKE